MLDEKADKEYGADVNTALPPSLHSLSGHSLSAMEAAERAWQGAGGITPPQPPHPCQVAATRSSGWKAHLALATFPQPFSPGSVSGNPPLTLMTPVAGVNAHQCTQCFEPGLQKSEKPIPLKTVNHLGKTSFLL